MEEEDYIELNNLLVKYKVLCLKTYSNFKTDSKTREKSIKQVRYIDFIRKDMPLKLEEATNEKI